MAPAGLCTSGWLWSTAANYNILFYHSTLPTPSITSPPPRKRRFHVANGRYLPHGEYLVSRTLTALSNSSWNAGDINNTWPCRFQPNVVLGARARWPSGPGGVPTRPTLVLADNAPGFDNPDAHLPVIDFTRSTDARHPAVVSGTNFNQLLRGVDIRIGAGTPYATGVQMPGAQGSSVQDVTVTVGSGYAGIVGGSGAGGGHAMVTVIGGRVGLDYTVSLNSPATTGATLINQTEAAILFVTRCCKSLPDAQCACAMVALCRFAAHAFFVLQAQICLCFTSDTGNDFLEQLSTEASP